MKPHEQVTQLEKEKAALEAQVAGLKKRVEELEAAKPKSKTREQAEKGLEMLKKGPVTVAQLKTLNDKYPTDVIYFVRNTLKVDIKTVRTPTGTVYMTGEHFAIYQAGQAKEKSAGKDAKEEIQQAQISQAPEVATHVAV